MPIDRYVGEVKTDGTLKNPELLTQQGVISRTVELIMPAYDIDFAQGEIGQLQREALEASSGGSAVGVDTNNNSKFDFLDATIPVNLLNGSYYNWSARLVDKNQNQIALTSGGGSLSAGNADVKLRFNGAAIGDNKG